MNSLRPTRLSFALALSAAILLSAVASFAQQIPPGTALPIFLNTTLDARKLKPGQPVKATIQQDVPLSSGAKIPDGSHVYGQVLQAGTNPDGSSYVRLRFDHLRLKDRDIPILTSLRALASFVAVHHAQLPPYSPPRGETSANWTTTQVGGDIVYRGGGPVMHENEVVGEPVPGGVLVVLRAVPSAGCETDSGDRKLALWLFSSYACGAYGFDDLTIARNGSSSPLGEIVLASRQLVKIPSGSGMLLITLRPTEARAFSLP